MFSRWFNAGVLVFWLVAMSWLLSQKVIPPMLAGDPPDYQASLVIAADAPPPPPVCWQVEWNGRLIGRAASQPVTTPGGVELRSVIRFTKLPVQDMLKQFLGKMALLIQPGLAGEDFSPNMHVATRLRFDESKQLSSFQTVVDLQELPRFIDLDGRVDAAGKLRMTASAAGTGSLSGGASKRVTYRQELQLPPDALVGDSLAPRAELRNLKVGQQWTIPTYRPFPPNSPVQILLAKVEGTEFVPYGEEMVETLMVVYHDDAGSGLGTARGPIGRTWVLTDGTVLKQEVMFSNMRFTFSRIPALPTDECLRNLADEPFLALFAAMEEDQKASPATNRP